MREEKRVPRAACSAGAGAFPVTVVVAGVELLPGASVLAEAGVLPGASWVAGAARLAEASPPPELLPGAWLPCGATVAGASRCTRRKPSPSSSSSEDWSPSTGVIRREYSEGGTQSATIPNSLHKGIMAKISSTLVLT